jgi:mRNA interferase YafQ
MRTIESTKVFRRDYKKAIVELIGDRLAADIPLDVRYRDHPLSGVYTGCRECHLKPDLLLVYAKPDSATLRLLRLGSHSELF